MTNDHVQLSDELVTRIRLAEVRSYVLAQECGLAPSQLSGWLNRAVPVRADDPRALRLAQLMGVERAVAFAPWSPARGLVGAGIEHRGRR